MSHTSFARQRIALKHFLLGRRFYKALRALSEAEEIHAGTRRDGDPEFSHQVAIALYLTTLPIADDPLERIIILAILHDSYEDYSFVATEYGEDIHTMVKMLSKIKNGSKLPNHVYYMENLLSASDLPIVKGVDRIHNLSTCGGAFSNEKLASYIDETNTCVLPMLKTAMHKYPENMIVLQNIRSVIKMLVKVHTDWLTERKI